MKTFIRLLGILLLFVTAHLMAAEIEPFFAPFTWIGNDGGGFDDYVDDTQTGNWETDVEWVDMAGATLYDHAWRKANFVDPWENTITMAWPGSHWPVSTGGTGTNVTVIGTNTFTTNIVDTDLESWPFPSEWKWHRDTWDEYFYDPYTLDPGYGYEGHWDLNTAQLWTGGDPSVTNMNLIRVNLAITANHLGSVMTVDDFFIGEEQCDTNGDVFFKLADNQWVDGTVDTYVWPVWYEYEVTPVKGKLQIWRNGTNITDATNTVIVGEQISLWCGFTNDVATITNFSWTIPGDHLANYDPTVTPPVFVPDVTTTNQTAIFYWWKEATNLEVSCSVTVKGFSFSAKTTFNVLAPHETLTLAFGPTMISSNWSQEVLALHFGEGITNGITMEATTNSVPGSYEWLQLGGVNGGYRRCSSNTWMRASDTGIDLGFPYGAFSSLSAGLFLDSPGIGIDPSDCSVSYDATFNTFLMFKPAAGGIWVPIKQLDWNWSAAGTNSFGSFAISASSYSTNATPHEPSGFPNWDHVLTYSFQPAP